MVTRFSVAPLSTTARTLASVARGDEPPDLVISGARVLSTYSERVIEEQDVWVKSGRIAAVKPAGSYPVMPGDRTVRYDAQGGIVAPTLFDSWVPIESSLVSLCAYAEPAVLSGTTAIICDAQGFATVSGRRGVEWLLADARRAPFSAYMSVPGGVGVAGAEVETTGGDLSPNDVAELFDQWPEALTLSARMDSPWILRGAPRREAAYSAALERGRVIGGLALGNDFAAAHGAFGLTDLRDPLTSEALQEALDAGMWVLVRGGPPDGTRLARALAGLSQSSATAKRVCLCTGERDASDLFAYGLDWVVRQAVAAGIAPAAAWSMASLHPAIRYGLDAEIGGIAPARRADFVLLNDELEVQSTWYGGQLVVDQKKITSVFDKALSKRFVYPKGAHNTIRSARRLKLVPDLPKTAATANAIRLDTASGRHELERVAIPAHATWPVLLSAHKLCFVAVVDRYERSTSVAHGLLKGLGLRSGAVATSVAQGAQNFLIAGSNADDMELALATVKKMSGGMCIARDGQVLVAIELPVAGLISDQRAPDIARELRVFKTEWERLGCTAPFSAFARLPLPLVGDCCITDRGLFRVPELTAFPLFESASAQA